MIKLGDYVVTPTIFPDGTSQCWKLPEEVLRTTRTVTWEFENEAELSHVMQLGYLLQKYHDKILLDVPFLPYGRQDKNISNDATFARNVIVRILSMAYYSIYTDDIHSPHHEVNNRVPDLKEVLLDTKPDIICFPDEGASKRGYPTYFYNTIILDKDRDQLTGDIKGLKFLIEGSEKELPNTKVLIVDDLTDGGRTFIEAAKLLKGAGAKEVYLYTTHGIYSKGTQILFDSGIDRVFNRKGEVLPNK